MLDINFIRENLDVVRAAIKNKNRQSVDLDRILRLADERRKLAGELAEVNRKRKIAAAARDAEMGRELKGKLADLEGTHASIEKELVSLLIKIPNIPSADTPVGPDESANKILRQWGEPPTFEFNPKEHFVIGKELGIIDSEKASEVSGARFTYLKGDAALLQFALIQLALKILTSQEELEKVVKGWNLPIDPKPFIPVVPPVMMRSGVMNRMARLDPIEERYYFEKDDLVFVGSAEHTLGPLHMDETIEERRLPIRYVGYSTAFRREAGSYGKDTKGILRLHQFDKVEMESFTLPEEGMSEHEFLVAVQEYLVQQLKIPYRVMLISTGDMGFPNHRQVDIEMWMPGQRRYRETHSADYVGGFQARRLNTKVRRTDGSSEPVHMNDATAFAIGRTLVAILENNQQEDGSVVVPEVLRPWMGKEKIEKSNHVAPLETDEASAPGR